MDAAQLATIAAASREAVARRDWAIGQAHDHGMSLRTIADAVGLSHMGVKHIVERRDR